MGNCVTCDAICERAGQHFVKTDCISYVPKVYPKPRTNADRLRAMTDEELADFLHSIIRDWGEGSAYLRGAAIYIDNWLDWLREEG